MSKQEQEDIQALKIAFEMNHWDDFLLVLNQIRSRDKALIRLYRKDRVALNKIKEIIN